MHKGLSGRLHYWNTGTYCTLGAYGTQMMMKLSQVTPIELI